MSTMSRPRKWTLYFVAIILAFQDVSYCQSIPCYDDTRHSSLTPDFLCELSKELSTNSAKSQLMNTLLTVAASKGILPDLASVLQPTMSSDSQPTTQLNQLNTQQPVSHVQKSINYAPSTAAPPCPQDYIVMQNPANTYTSLPQCEIIPQGISQPNIQGMPLDSYFSPFNNNCGTLQPGPVIIQSPQPQSEIWNGPSQVAQPENNFLYYSSTGNAEYGDLRSECFYAQKPTIVDSDNNMPFNVKIPLLNATDPKLNSCKDVSHACDSEESVSHMSLPQIIVTKSKNRSSIKKMLPAILLAMLLDDHEDGCSGCECDCDSDNKFIPIPYPIPIPINSLFMKNFKTQSDSSESNSIEDE